MTGQDDHDADSGLVQRLLARLYDRLGARVVLALIFAAWGITVVTAFLMAIVTDGYLELTGAEFRWLLLWAEGAAIVGPAAVMLTARDAVRAVLAWSGDARTRSNAPAAWNAVATYPAAILSRAVPVAAVLLCVGVTIVAVGLDVPLWAVLPMTLALATAVGGAFIVIIFGLEFVLRPMLEDIAAHLPPEFDPTHRGWSLRVKALAPLPVLTLVAAVGVGGFADLTATGPARLSVTYGIALVIVTIATAIFFIITRSVLDPIDQLTAATKRVRAGDLSTPVPVVTADDLGRLSANFNQMLVQLRESRARIVAASDAARRKVERDLHDGAQQNLVLLNLKLGLVRQAVAADPGSTALVDDARGELGRALAELRDLAHGIYPAALENDGLAGALGDAARRATIAATVECDGAGRYPPELEAAVYFCCLEALQNVAKHAGDDASATIRLGEDDDGLRFEVADDGRGYDTTTVEQGAGVQNMTDRIGALGGDLTIASLPGAGTTVSGRVPLVRSNSADDHDAPPRGGL